MSRRIVLVTFGSFGDLHPYLAVALGLRNRGHRCAIATSEVYRSKVEGEGLEFAAARPDLGYILDNPALHARLNDLRRGTEYVIREVILPELPQMYDDLLRICRGADLVLSHAMAYAVPLVAETLNLRWLSVALQPITFLSAEDPPLLAPAPWLQRLRRLGRRPYSAALGLLRRRTIPWVEPIHELRRRLGLNPARAHPLFRGQFSPFGTLGWFPPLLAAPQEDWPPGTILTGFPRYDRLEAGSGLPHAIEEFLAGGPPPVVFTLGSSAVWHPGSFFSESIAAVERLGCRAVMLVGRNGAGRVSTAIPRQVCVAEYAPYGSLFPRAAINVHQGGIGTTAQALHAGRPMIVVPFSHDQPDNAQRMERLGVAAVIPRSRYERRRVTALLERLLADESTAARAGTIGSELAEQDGVARACDAIEETLKG